MKEPLKQYKPAEKLELPKIKKEFPKVFKRLSCPSCGEALNAEHINLHSNVAKCGSCHMVFSIEEEMANLKVDEKEKVAEKEEIKQEVFRPEGVDLFYFKDNMEITVGQPLHWIDMSGIIFLPIFAIFSLIPYLEKSISTFIPLLLAAGALFFIFRAIGYRTAKTFIDINDRSLNIRHRPYNLKKDKTFSSEEIDQIYIKYADLTGHYVLYMIANGPKGQDHQELVSVSTIFKAQYLEKKIEEYLGIKNRKVSGEFK